MQREAVMDILRAHESELKAAGVAHIRLFGSVARGDVRAESDIDVLADFASDARVSLVTLGSLQSKLTSLLGADVDLSASAQVREQVRERAMQEAVLVFQGGHTHLRDILRSIALIDDFLQGIGFEGYEQDWKTKSAVERQLQIITEAAYRLGNHADEVCPGPDWKGYMGGNLLRHAYHRISDRIVWDTVIDDLPKLKLSVETALSK